MKKILSVFLIGSIVLLPIPAYATDNGIHTLKFDDIKQKMKTYSPLLWSIADPVSQATYDLSSGLDALKAAKAAMSLHPALGYTSGMTLLTIPIPAVAPPTSGDPNYDTDMLAYVNDQLSYLNLYNYVNQLTSIQTQIDSLQKSSDNMWNSWLQVEQGQDQAIWGAQQAFLGYLTLSEQKVDLTNSLNTLQDQQKAQQLRESLGMSTHINTLKLEDQLTDMNSTLDKLNRGMASIEGQLNVMLGQDYDTSLTIEEPTEVTQSMIDAIDYDSDLSDALINSYNVRLQVDDSYKTDDARRNFTLAFYNAYHDVLDKNTTINLEQNKLKNSQSQYDQALLMNSLGLLSKLDFEGARLSYFNQVSKVESVKQDLLKAYTAYNWMKEGLTITSSSSASITTGANTSTSASIGTGF